jgi:hypothetical protein
MKVCKLVVIGMAVLGLMAYTAKADTFKVKISLTVYEQTDNDDGSSSVKKVKLKNADILDLVGAPADGAIVVDSEDNSVFAVDSDGAFVADVLDLTGDGELVEAANVALTKFKDTRVEIISLFDSGTDDGSIFCTESSKFDADDNLVKFKKSCTVQFLDRDNGEPGTGKFRSGKKVVLP